MYILPRIVPTLSVCCHGVKFSSHTINRHFGKTFFIQNPNNLWTRFSSTNTIPKPEIGPSQTEQIYTGPLTDRIRAVKVFSLTTSVIGLAIQPILVEQGAKLGSTPMIIFLCSFAGFFTFVTPLFLHLITKKYVCAIYYNRTSKEYTAITISLLLRKKEVHILFVSEIIIKIINNMIFL